MRKVIGIGETVLDIIFRDNQPIQAVPGGSTFNSVISLGRAGVPVKFISEAGNDRVGRQIIQYLEDNGVDATNVCMFPNSKSPISLAFLDEQNNAEYLFYKDHPNDRLDFVYPDIQPDDVILFGSFFAINPVIRPQVFGFLDYARQHGAILYYDVNYRSSHKGDLMKVTPNLLENFEMTDILRGSDEDFEVIYGKRDCDAVYRSEISFYTKKFIYTRSSQPVELRADGGFAKQYPVAPTETVSTVGAGDNFNAGFVYGLIKYGITRNDIEAGLSEEQWDQLMACAQAFSANCCKSLNNSIDADFARKVHL
ncbi:MAG: carbohydrate kinase [Prevotella sp.]|jgi:fructokinase|nr:carbohydrate kinase [Prevotella sp.]